MAIIGGGLGGGFSGPLADPSTELLLGSLESVSFAPSPFAVAGAFGGGFPPAAPAYQFGPNPLMQLLPLLMGTVQGLGQGWSQFGGGGGGGFAGGGFAPPPPVGGGGGGGCNK